MKPHLYKTNEVLIRRLVVKAMFNSCICLSHNEHPIVKKSIIRFAKGLIEADIFVVCVPFVHTCVSFSHWLFLLDPKVLPRSLRNIK